VPEEISGPDLPPSGAVLDPAASTGDHLNALVVVGDPLADRIASRGLVIMGNGIERNQSLRMGKPRFGLHDPSI
jgi:hypothetical protein